MKKYLGSIPLYLMVATASAVAAEPSAKETVAPRAEAQQSQPADARVTPAETGFYACYTDYQLCELDGDYGIINGWWTNFNCTLPTPQCGRNLALLYQY
jgi:hypothetical protein